MPHEVFISYASKDKTVADAVCARLEARGVRCWIAPRDVQPGANYGAAIIDAITSARAMVLVLSSNANASRHIPNEIERAVSHGVMVLPFRIEDVVPAKSLDLFIGSVHWLDALTPPLERHLDQLADSLLKLLPDRAAAGSGRIAPPPAPPPPRPVPVPRPNGFRALIAAAAVAAVVLLAWSVFSPTPDAVGTTPSAGPAVAGDAILGCWRWGNGANVVIRPDGTITAPPFTGQWRALGGRRYTFTWPEPVDTLALSADARQLAGGNQYGASFTATRVSGGPDLPGLWQWGGVLTTVVEANGTVRAGTLNGTWVLTDRSQRLYQVTWPKMQDEVTLSDNASSLQGGNQYGASVSGQRLQDCG